MTADLQWGSASHQGNVRTHNEDALLAGPTVFAVADGMGGHAGGEVASAIAVAELASIQGVGTDAPGVIAALERTNAEIIRRAAAGDGPAGMGTTIAGIAATADGFVVFNLGDSRVYRFRAGELVQLTEDHSLVAELVRDGLLTESGARQHPKRNVITRALGVTDVIEPAVFTVEHAPDDVFIIASDGLFNEVEPPEMGRILDEDTSIELTARRLLEAALAHGGRDNISVVVIRVGTGDEAGEMSEDTKESPVATDDVTAEHDLPTLITAVPDFGTETESDLQEGDRSA